MPTARLSVLGSGTSTGVPMLGCRCRVCTSTDPRDRRTRPSILLRFPAPPEPAPPAPASRYGAESSPAGILIDTSPDFRAQALAAGLDRLDAVFYTHGHADHIFGMDDLRQLNSAHAGPIPVYANESTVADLRRVFRYVFDDNYPHSAIPRIAAHVIVPPDPITVAGTIFEPLGVMHGDLPILAYRFGANAYVTDFSEIPAPALERLRNLDVLILDALRHRPHPTHSTVANSLRLVETLAPRRAFFTHISHDLLHAETERALPAHVRLAYDGLELDVEI